MDRLIEEIGPGVSSARSADKMVQVLVELGWEAETAAQFITAAHGTMRCYVGTPAGRTALARFYRRCMWLGIVWASAGVVIGLAAWACAVGLPGGRPTAKGMAAVGILNFIAWTSTAAGIVYFLRGLLGRVHRPDDVTATK